MDDWEYVSEVDVLAKLPANFNELRESKNWKERKEALDALVALLEANPRLCTKASYGEIIQNLQTMLAKDANINVNALAAQCLKGFATGLRTKFGPYASSVIPIVIEKLKEKKPLLRDPLVECIDAVTATISSLELVQEEIVAGLGKPNPQIKQQLDSYLYRQLNLLTPDKAPKKLIKVIVPILVKHSADADQEVREASLTAIGAVQRLIGDKNCRTLITDLANDEAKMKKVSDAAVKAAESHAESQAKLAAASGGGQAEAAAPEVESGSGRAASSSAQAAAPVKEADPFDFLEAFDVLSKMPADFETNMESKKWTERRDALQALLDIITANPKLDPKGSYGELVSTLKKTIEKDANINVAALAAKCLTAVAAGLRKKFSSHVSSVVPAILEKFKEKKPLMRDPLIECIDAVAASTTLEAIGEELLVALEKPNPNIKIQTDLFLYRAFKLLNATTMPKKTLKSMAPLLIKHTSDSDPEVRDASYAALGSAMRAIGEKACLPLLSEIVEDKLKMTKIKEFYAKACEEAGPEVMMQMVQSVHKSDAPPPAAEKAPPAKKAPEAKKAPPKPPSDEEDNTADEEEALKPPAGAPVVKKDKKPVAKKEAPKKEEAEEEPVKKPNDELLAENDEKLTRMKDERTLKILKWNFVMPDDEHITQLQELLGKHAKASLIALLFHKDFKQHLKAIEILSKAGETNPSVLIKNSDLLLKWCSLRFFETNPAALIKVLELAKQILTLCRAAEEPMATEEMNAFVPYLLQKLGEQKENMRLAVRDIIEELTDINGPFKMCPLLLEALKTKNARQRAECLQVMEIYISRVGLSQLKTLSIHKAIAACVSDRDVNVRNAAINGLVACYREEGDQMWRSVGKMADKERAMVEERIKRTGAAAGTGAPKLPSTPARNGAKVVVPPGGEKKNSLPPDGANATVVRRPQSRGRRDDSASRTRENSPEDNRGRRANDTYVNGGDGRSRYAIDDDFVEQHALNSTHMIGDLDANQLVLKAPVVSNSPLKRSGSSSSISSIDTMDQLEKVIQNISSGLVAVARDAIEQVYYLTSVDEQRVLLEERMDMIMRAIATQINLIRQIHSLHSKDGYGLLKMILNFLAPIVGISSQDKPQLRIDIDDETSFLLMWELVNTLCITMHDPKCASMPEAQHTGRSLNQSILRLCGRVEPTVFFNGLSKCMSKALLETPEGDVVQLFSKCLYKWSEMLSKNPVRLYLDSFVRHVNDFFQVIEPLSEQHPDTVYADGIRSIEVCTEKVVVIMGAALMDSVRRLHKPHPHTLGYISHCIKSFQDLQPGWTPLLPGAIPEEPRRRAGTDHSANTGGSSTGRHQLHILVDNVIRDLGNCQKHLEKLTQYLESHPQEGPMYEDYLNTVPMGSFTKEIMAKYYSVNSQIDKIASISNQVYVTTAQNMFTFRARMDALKSGAPTSMSNGTGASHRDSQVLQPRDINTDSFSGDLPVPENLVENRTKMAAPKKRRTIDPATLGAIQSRLAGIGDA